MEESRDPASSSNDDTLMLGARRGWPLSRRVRSKDSFGLLLALIVVSLLASAFTTGPVTRGLAGLVTSGVLVFAVWTSGVGRRWIWAVVGLAVVLVVITVTLGAESGVRLSATSAVLTVMGAGAGLAIAIRLSQYSRINGSFVLAVLCIFLLLGFTFASLYGVIGGLDSGPFFAQADVGDGDWVTRLYYSYVTLTTLGYGDLTAATSVGQMLSVTEAVLGQLYLVSVVALVVGNIGSTRPGRRDG